MAVTYQSASSVAWNSPATSNVVDKPTGVVEGDLMVACVGVSSDGGTVTPPTDWTLIAGSDGGDGGLWTYYKVAGASEPANYTWSFSNSVSSSIGVIRCSGQDGPTITIANDYTTVSNTASPTFTGGVTPSTTFNLMVFGIMVSDDSGSPDPGTYSIATNDPTWTEVVLRQQVTNHDTLAIAVAERPEATATGNYSVATGGTASADSFAILLSIPTEPDVTVIVTPLIVASTVPNASVTGTANVTATPLIITSTIPDSTITTEAGKVTNLDKSTASSVTNLPKS